MTGRKTLAAVLGGLLLVLASIGRRTDTPSPPPAPAGSARVAAVEYRSRAAGNFRSVADQIDAGGFETEIDEAKAAAAGAKQASKVVDEAFAAMYAATREKPEAERRSARSAFYREFGDAIGD